MTCCLCPHRCDIPEGKTGFCRARTNIGGQIICSNYGKLTALALDPIEKKPLVRFHPGSSILSAGSYGCNLSCPFCQNSDIAMADASIRTEFYSPERLVRMAQEMVPEGNIGIAFTYNEPLIGWEYVRDCSALARKHGLKTVLVTNGMVCREPLLALLPFIDAMNIDLKGFTQEFYDIVGGNLETVMQSIELSEPRCHVEITTLILPGLNDSADEMHALSGWLATVNPRIPLHISRFFPRYKMRDTSPTPIHTITSLREIALRNLQDVFTGNC